MADFREQLQTLSSRTTRDLEDELRRLLDRRHESTVRGSLNNDFKEACFTRIAPDTDPEDYLRDWPNYNDSWGPGKSLATALRMLLTDQIGLPVYAVLDGYKKQVLAEIIIGIRAADNGIKRAANAHVPVTLPPDIPLPVEDPPSRTRQSDSREANLTSLSNVSDMLPPSQEPPDKYAVYVLDCTPPVKEERDALYQLRRDAWAKAEYGYRLNPKERSAQALNRGERVLYIGQTNDVVDRMERHRDGASAGSARFTNLFYPKGVIEVSWHSSEDEAKAYEQQRTTELTVSGESFAYFN